MNVTELIQRMRDILGELPQTVTSAKQWSDEQLLRHLNGAYDSLWNRARQADENWGLTYASLQDLGAVMTDIGGSLYSVQLPVEMGTVVHLEEGVSGDDYPSEILPSTVRMKGWHQNTLVPWFANNRGWWPGANGSQLYITKSGSISDVATSQIRVWFIRKAPHLLRFTSTTAPTTTTIGVDISSGGTFGSLKSPAGYYAGATIELSTKQRFFVTAYAVSAFPVYRMTLHIAHGLGASNNWELLPMFPEEHHELLAQFGARKALTKGGDVKQREVVGAEAAEGYAEFVNAIETRQIQQPRYVNMEN